MGKRVSLSTGNPSGSVEEGLGNLLYGRFSEVVVDSVETARDLRERERN